MRIPDPLRKTGEAGNIGKHHRHRPDRAARARLDAFAREMRTRSAGMSFRNAARPPAMSAIAPDNVQFGSARSAAAPGQVQTLNVHEFAGHLDQRCGDDALRRPCRQQAGGDDQEPKAEQQLAYSRPDRAEKFGFRDDRRKRPAGKGRQRKGHFIVRAAGGQRSGAPTTVAVIAASGLLERRVAIRSSG